MTKEYDFANSPYLPDIKNKIIVIKYGGNAMTSEELKAAVMSDLVFLKQAGAQPVLIHGGGPEISATMKEMGLTPRFIDGLRYTDADTMRVVQMVLCGKTNKDLVKLINMRGGKAMGLSGLDGGMIKTEKLMGQTDLGFVGNITAVDPQPVADVMDKGYIPVIAAVGVDDAGQVYNINADTAAAAIAAALNCGNITLMTDIKGLMRDPGDENSLITAADTAELAELIDKGTVSGGMIPKVRCCMDAVKTGVREAHIIDGRVPHSLLIELLTDEPIGTKIVK